MCRGVVRVKRCRNKRAEKTKESKLQVCNGMPSRPKPRTADVRQRSAHSPPRRLRHAADDSPALCGPGHTEQRGQLRLPRSSGRRHDRVTQATAFTWPLHWRRTRRGPLSHTANPQRGAPVCNSGTCVYAQQLFGVCDCRVPQAQCLSTVVCDQNHFYCHIDANSTQENSQSGSKVRHRASGMRRGCFAAVADAHPLPRGLFLKRQWKRKWRVCVWRRRQRLWRVGWWRLAVCRRVVDAGFLRGLLAGRCDQRVAAQARRRAAFTSPSKLHALRLGCAL